MNGNRYRPSLGVALHADIVPSDIVELSRIHDVLRCRVCHVFAAGTVTLFAANVPLGHLLGFEVVVDGMAPSQVGPVGRPTLSFG